MKTDTSGKGLEDLIVAAMTGMKNIGTLPVFMNTADNGRNISTDKVKGNRRTSSL